MIEQKLVHECSHTHTCTFLSYNGNVSLNVKSFHREVNQCLRAFVGVWDIQAGETNQMVHMNILITCVFAAFLMGALLAGLIVFCYRDSVLRKPRHVHKDTESAPSCSDSTGSFVKLNGLFDSPVKVQL